MHHMPRLGATLLLIAAGCGAEAPPSPDPVAPPAYVAPGGPPTIPVVQTRPPAIRRFGWLDGSLVYVLGDDARLYVWDTRTNRVLSNEALSGYPDPSAFEVRPGGLRRGAEELSLATGTWHAVEPSSDGSGPRARVEMQEHYPPRTATVTRDGADPVSILAPRGAVTLTPDERFILWCSPDGPRFFDARTGDPLGMIAVEDPYCIWPEGPGPLAVTSRLGAVLVDWRTRARLGSRFDGAIDAHVSTDGRRVGLIMRTPPGIAVRDIESGTELFRTALERVDEVRVMGDVVAYTRRTEEDAPVGGAFVLPSGRALMDEVPGFTFDGVGPLGVLAVEEGLLTYRGLDGAVARYDHPTLATLFAQDDGGFARAGAAIWALGPGLAARRFASCPGDPESLTTLLRIGARFYARRDGCVAADDGTLLDPRSTPLVGAAEADVSIWLEDGAMVVRRGPGAASVPLRFDEGESQPCAHAPCPYDLLVSDDGEHLVMVRGPLLRVFDTHTGVAVSRVALATQPRALQLAGSSRALLLESFEGRSWLRIPALSLVTRLEPPTLHRFTHTTRAVGAFFVETHPFTVEAGGPALTVRSDEGRVLSQRDLPRPSFDAMGDLLVVSSTGQVHVMTLPALEDAAVVSGVALAHTGRALLICRDGSLVGAMVGTDGRLEESLLDAACVPENEAVGENYLIDLGDDLMVAQAASGPILIRRDGAVLSVVPVARGDELRWVSRSSEAESLGEGVETMLRSPGLTPEGMIPAPGPTQSVAAWASER